MRKKKGEIKGGRQGKDSKEIKDFKEIKEGALVHIFKLFKFFKRFISWAPFTLLLQNYKITELQALQPYAPCNFVIL